MITNMSPKTEVIVAVLAYSFCSGTLVLLNKIILSFLPFPSLVITFQLIAALAFIFSAKYMHWMEVDPIKWVHVAPYLLYTVGFSLGVYCNMKSLSYSNVETVIVFRALSPCLVAFLDAIFLGRELPSKRSWLALILIVLGAYGYASFDVKFQSQGLGAYMWPFFYLIVISFEMCYGKKIIKSVDLKTKSGPVLYTNLLGLFPMLMFAAMGNEYSKFYDSVWVHDTVHIPMAAWFFMILGCITGTGIGYSSWWCRDKISATSFTLVGVMNKCMTIFLNFFIWDKHAPPQGIAFLFLCLVGGSIYQQAPMQAVIKSHRGAAVGGDDVWEANIKDSLIGEEDIELLDKKDATQ